VFEAHSRVTQTADLTCSVEMKQTRTISRMSRLLGDEIFRQLKFKIGPS
jgi:hypothetical protein